MSVRPPHHRRSDERWYQGTADAIQQNIDAVSRSRCDHVLILSGDHIYKMDYGLMLKEHLEKKAVLTIGAVKIPVEESPRMGISPDRCERPGRGVRGEATARCRDPGRAGNVFGLDGHLSVRRAGAGEAPQ